MTVLCICILVVVNLLVDASHIHACSHTHTNWIYMRTDIHTDMSRGIHKHNRVVYRIKERGEKGEGVRERYLQVSMGLKSVLVPPEKKSCVSPV